MVVLQADVQPAHAQPIRVQGDVFVHALVSPSAALVRAGIRIVVGIQTLLNPPPNLGRHPFELKHQRRCHANPRFAQIFPSDRKLGSGGRRHVRVLRRVDQRKRLKRPLRPVRHRYGKTADRPDAGNRLNDRLHRADFHQQVHVPLRPNHAGESIRRRLYVERRSFHLVEPFLEKTLVPVIAAEMRLVPNVIHIEAVQPSKRKQPAQHIAVAAVDQKRFQTVPRGRHRGDDAFRIRSRDDDVVVIFQIFQFPGWRRHEFPTFPLVAEKTGPFRFHPPPCRCDDRRAYGRQHGQRDDPHAAIPPHLLPQTVFSSHHKTAYDTRLLETAASNATTPPRSCATSRPRLSR